MTTTYSEPITTKSALTITLNSLANVTYVAATAIDVSAIDPIDVIVEIEVTPGTVAGNKRLVVFLQESLDNSNFSTGPTSVNLPKLRGKSVNAKTADAASETAFAGAHGREHNTFKIELGKRTLSRALQQAAALEI